jgi:hypothetical protein
VLGVGWTFCFVAGTQNSMGLINVHPRCVNSGWRSAIMSTAAVICARSTIL